MSDQIKKLALWIIAGANGVGKTTYAKAYIKQVTGSDIFVNQDEIAKGLAPLRNGNPEDLIAAARISIELRNKLLRANKDFTIETTLSGKSYLPFIDKAKANGYSINLLYFFVNDLEESLRRIQRRVESGGHFVSREDATRRFPRSLKNLEFFIKKADHWAVIDNNEIESRVVVDYSDNKVSLLRRDLLEKSPMLLQKSLLRSGVRF